MAPTRVPTLLAHLEPDHFQPAQTEQKHFASRPTTVPALSTQTAFDSAQRASLAGLLSRIASPKLAIGIGLPLLSA